MSWLIFYFFYDANPVLLQNANFETIFYDYTCFFGLLYFDRSWLHCYGVTLRFYCDFVFLCLRVLTISGYTTFFLIYLGCWRQLMVFLCNFFFLLLRLLVDSVLKMLRFLISMFILILLGCSLVFGVTARLITLRIYFDGEWSLV